MTGFLNNFCSIGLSFKSDGFRLLYFGLSLFVFIVCSVSAAELLKGKKKTARFTVSWIVTFLCTAGFLFAGDLFTCFMFFEIMSLASTIWVFQEENERSDYAGRVYLRISVICGMVMLYGLFLVAHNFGTLDLDELTILARKAPIAYKLVPTLLISVGFAAKAGVFALHVWLPKAYTEAVAPGTAFLSAILSKAGIIGMILTASALGMLENEVLGNLLLILGACTMVTGAFLAIFNADLKKTIACSSLSQIGFIVTGVACMVIRPDGVAYTGTVLHMINHTLIKTTLFLAAGAIFKAAGTYDLNELKGYGRKKPFLAVVFAVCGLSLAGIPMFSGFMSKNMMHEALDVIAEDSVLAEIISVVFTVTGGLTLCYMLKLFICLFVEKGKGDNTGDIPVLSKCIVLVTGACVLVTGLAGAYAYIPSKAVLTEYAKAAGELDFEEVFEFSFFTPAILLTSLISAVVGCAAYFIFVRLILIASVDGKKRYTRVLPGWFDLERYVYRPVFMYFLPFVLAFAARLFDKLTDLVIYFFRKKVFKPLKKRKHAADGNSFVYVFGTLLDKITRRTVKPGKVSYVTLLALFNEQTAAMARIIERSLSLSMLLFSTGLVITLIYMLFK